MRVTVRRAKAALLIAGGRTVTETARECSITEATLRRWRQGGALDPLVGIAAEFLASASVPSVRLRAAAAEADALSTAVAAEAGRLRAAGKVSPADVAASFDACRAAAADAADALEDAAQRLRRAADAADALRRWG